MLLARAVTAGAAAWAIADMFVEVPAPDAVYWALIGGAVAVLALSWMETVSHGTRHVELAVHNLVKGDNSPLFWGGIALGAVVPIIFAVFALWADDGGVALGVIAGLAALFGMFLSETAFVRAGQSVPLS